MRSLRFSIAGLMGVVLLAAIGFAALRNPSENWAGIVLLATLGALGIATIGAFCRSGGCARRFRWLRRLRVDLHDRRFFPIWHLAQTTNPEPSRAACSTDRRHRRAIPDFRSHGRRGRNGWHGRWHAKCQHERQRC